MRGRERRGCIQEFRNWETATKLLYETEFLCGCNEEKLDPFLLKAVVLFLGQKWIKICV